MSFSLTTTVRKYPSLPYKKMKDGILGSDYSLSLVFVGDKKSRRLNRDYRNKTYTPNVLSFPLDTKTGEIFINPHRAAKEAPRHNMSTRTYIAFLFIHGLLHLEGYQHSDRMDKAEKKYLKQFGFK